MSSFNELTDAEKIQRLRLLGRAAFQMAMASQVTLVSRGLISPDELSALIQPVIETFEEAAGTEDDEIGKLIEAFAGLKSLAAQTWKDR